MRTPRRTVVVVLAVLACLLSPTSPALSAEGSPSHRVNHKTSYRVVPQGTERRTVQKRRSVSDLLFGAWVGGMQADPSKLTSFENLVGAPTEIASYYYGYGDVFPGPAEAAFADNGDRHVLVSWDMGPTRFTDWSSGSQDSYLDQIVAQAKTYPHDLYVRPWPEMNGDWQDFQPTPDGAKPYGGTYDQFKAAWQYVVSYVRGHGATNIKWVFNPSADTYSQTTPVASIWPGDDYVDVLGLDGFNWGTDKGWGRWRSFRSIFTGQYRNLTRLDATAPVWICEFGSKEADRNDGAPVDRRHSKASWIDNAFRDALSMPRVQGMVYFDERKERDWRVDSSRSALQALRQQLD